MKPAVKSTSPCADEATTIDEGHGSCLANTVPHARVNEATLLATSCPLGGIVGCRRVPTILPEAAARQFATRKKVPLIDEVVSCSIAVASGSILPIPAAGPRGPTGTLLSQWHASRHHLDPNSRTRRVPSTRRRRAQYKAEKKSPRSPALRRAGGGDCRP
jgi:hypothetical protein